jgi:hypothetical protein
MVSREAGGVSWNRAMRRDGTYGTDGTCYEADIGNKKKQWLDALWLMRRC